MTEFRKFPIAPILEHYEFPPLPDGYGWKPVLCVFHGDKDASGSVNTELQVYNCWVCDIKGSATQIIMKMEGVTLEDAYRRAEEITGNSGTAVRGGRGSRTSVPRGEGHYRSYREVRDAWLRQESGDGP